MHYFFDAREEWIFAAACVTDALFCGCESGNGLNDATVAGWCDKRRRKCNKASADNDTQ